MLSVSQQRSMEILPRSHTMWTSFIKNPTSKVGLQGCLSMKVVTAVEGIESFNPVAFQEAKVESHRVKIIPKEEKLEKMARRALLASPKKFHNMSYFPRAAKFTPMTHSHKVTHVTH